MGQSDVRRLIKQTGLKKQDLAVALGASVASLRRWERADGVMPEDKQVELQRLAQGGRPQMPLKQEVPAVLLADFPSDVLIEELARRARGGLLRDSLHQDPDAKRQR